MLLVEIIKARLFVLLHWHATRQLRQPTVNLLFDLLLLRTLVTSGDTLCLKLRAVYIAICVHGLLESIIFPAKHCKEFC